MKQRRFIFSLLIFSFLSLNANAGRESGGDNAVDCRDNAGAILSAEVLDLYEARVIDGLSIQVTVESAVERARRLASLLKGLNPEGLSGAPAELE